MLKYDDQAGEIHGNGRTCLQCNPTRSVGVSEVEQETEKSEQDDVGDGPAMTVPEFRERKRSPRMQA